MFQLMPVRARTCYFLALFEAATQPTVGSDVYKRGGFCGGFCGTRFSSGVILLHRVVLAS